MLSHDVIITLMANVFKRMIKNAHGCTFFCITYITIQGKAVLAHEMLYLLLFIILFELHVT